MKEQATYLLTINNILHNYFIQKATHTETNITYTNLKSSGTQFLNNIQVSQVLHDPVIWYQSDENLVEFMGKGTSKVLQLSKGEQACKYVSPVSSTFIITERNQVCKFSLDCPSPRPKFQFLWLHIYKNTNL